VHALVDAARRGRGGGPVFRRRIREWLEALEHKPATLEPARRILVGLTLEVDPGSRLRTKAPMLHRLLRSEWETGTPLSATRRRWLVQIEASTLLADILQFWKRNAGRLIPDPAGSVKARYEEHAEWLAATRELDTGAYERIVKEWAVRHKRRRNLWEAIAKQGLPVPPA